MIRRQVYAACAASFAIGLFFVLVWAPHPWGWAGFDNYYDYGRMLARGEPYPTIDRPWGYAYYLAAFYRLFGDRPWIPLLVQVALNATLPLLVYRYARDEFDERVAGLAAILTGVLSFNTVYASTQDADALSTVIFIAGVLLFARGRRRRDWRLHAAAGALFGMAPQFRPNLILVPVLLAVFLAIEGRDRARVAHACVLLLTATAMLMPWAVRNRRLTGELMFTTTHGSMQLWYGTLQTGPYLKSRAYNPRSVFETGSFPYTSLDHVGPVVTARLAACAREPAGTPTIVYWTDRDEQRRRVATRWSAPRQLVADLPPSPAPTAYYFYVDGIEPSGERDPRVFFVSADHLGDLDRHGDLLDVFDVVRLVRHIAWSEPASPLDRLDADGDGRLTRTDVAAAVHALLPEAERGTTDVRIDHDVAAATLTLGDGSSLIVPRSSSGRITDLAVSGPLASALVHASAPFSALAPDDGGPEGSVCGPLEAVGVNAPFYRQELDAARRYTALSVDNIRRDPAAYLAAVAYRALRVFFVEGTSDPNTTHQFTGSGRIYRAAQAVSIALMLLFAAGVWAAWRRGAAIVLPLMLIAYIPATLAFVLTNMRYSITVQPLMFVFMAAALIHASEARWGKPHRAEIQTGHPL